MDNGDGDRSLFFAGSDDESEDFLDYLTPPQPAPVPEVTKPADEPQPSAPNTLFFADSEDEDEAGPSGIPSPIESASDGMDVDVKPPELQSGRASSVSSVSSAPIPGPSSPASSVAPESRTPPPRKKRKLSPEPQESGAFESAYLGSFLVADAWSTVRGKGYVKVCLCFHLPPPLIEYQRM